MSEARALGDKLKEVQEELRQTREQLDKQRTQHAREQEALRKALEETRREATRLRARVEKAEERREGQAGARVVPTAPALAENTATVSNVLVALARPPPSVDGALPALSRLLRSSPVDVRMRLALPRPAILARLPALEAEMLRDLLLAEGFAAVLGEVSQLVQGLMQVRRFTLGEQSLSVENAKGERQQARYEDLRLLVRGRRKTTTVEIQEEVTYDPVRRRRVKEEAELKHEQVEMFLWVYGDGMMAAITEETSMAGLGALRGISKFATLQRLTEELRKRAPQAVFDDRLLRSSLSLPLVGPARSQEVLAGLTYEAIKQGLWP